MWTDLYALLNLVQALLAGAVCAVLVGRFRDGGGAYLRTWAVAWGAAAVALLAGSASVWAQESLPDRSLLAVALHGAVAAGEALQGAALLAGGLAFAGRPLSRRAERIGLGACLAVGGLLGQAPPDSSSLLGTLRAGALPALVGAAFIAAATLFWAARPVRRRSAALVPPAFALYGLVKLAYPALYWAGDPQAGAAAASLAGTLRKLVVVDSLLQALVGVAVLIWLLLEERGRLQTVSGELRRLARTDSLTRLPNRAAFLTALEAALPRAVAEQRELAIFFLDLDHFRELSGALGQARGDQLLQEVARRLHAALPQRAGLARLGNDEFAVLMPDPGPAAQVDGWAARLLDAVRAPLRLGEQEVRATASLGVALHPAHAGCAEALLASASLACALAQETGGDRAQVYAAALGEAARDRSSLTLALKEALRERQFVLHYQPIVVVPEGRVDGFEALLRWQRPGGGLVAPQAFLGLCRAAGIADELDDLVLHNACAAARELRAVAPEVRVSVNLSAPFFTLPSPVARVRAALEASGLPASAIVVEVTETAAMSDAEATLAVLRELKALGVRLAIDDFGTGYSSLSYLHRFPVDALKIDRSFVLAIAGAEARAVVEGILALARSLRLDVVAEGVETEEQLGVLRELGCARLQGYALGHPLPLAECAGWLGTRRRAREAGVPQPGAARVAPLQAAPAQGGQD